MKRVANKIAVQSLLYTVRPDELVRIIDYPTKLTDVYGDEGIIAFDDNLCGIHSYKYEHLQRAELLGTHIEVNKAGHPVLVLKVCTRHEEY